MEETKQIKLTVKTMDNRNEVYDVASNLTFGELKKMISLKFNAPPERQKIIYQGKMPKDDQKLCEFMKNSDELIHLMIRPDVQNQSPPPQVQSNNPSSPNLNYMYPNLNDPNSPNNQPNNPMSGIFNIVNSMLPAIGNLFNSPQNQGGQPVNVFSSIFQIPVPPNQNANSSLNPQPPNQPDNINPSINPQRSEPPRKVNNQPTVGNWNPPINAPIERNDQPRRPSFIIFDIQGGEEIKDRPSQVADRQPQTARITYRNIQEIGEINCALNGPNSIFHPPPMPPITNDRNSMHILGAYLYNLNMQLLRMAPYLSRLADFYQREHLVTNSQDRMDIQNMSHLIGNGLVHLIYSLAPVAHLFRDIQIGDNPGQFRIVNNPDPNLSNLARVDDSQLARPINISITGGIIGQPHFINPRQAPPKEMIEKGIRILTSKINSNTNDYSKNFQLIAEELNANQLTNVTLKDIYSVIGKALPENPFFNLVINNLTLIDFFKLMEGKFEIVSKYLPLLQSFIHRTYGEIPDLKLIEVSCQKFIETESIILEEMKNNILEGFDPKFGLSDALKENVVFLIERVLSQNIQAKDLSEFIKLCATKILGDSIKNTEDGFLNGIEGFVTFIVGNISKFILSGSASNNNNEFASSMIQIVKNYLPVVIKNVYRTYNEKISELKFNHLPPPERREVKKEESKIILENKNEELKTKGPEINKSVICNISEEKKDTQVSGSKEISSNKEEKSFADLNIVLENQNEDKKDSNQVHQTKEENTIEGMINKLNPEEKSLFESWKITIANDISKGKALKKSKPSRACLNMGSLKSEHTSKAFPPILKKYIYNSLKEKVSKEEANKINLDDFPIELEKLYKEQIVSCIKKRVQSDENYDPSIYTNVAHLIGNLN